MPGARQPLRERPGSSSQAGQDGPSVQPSLTPAPSPVSRAERAEGPAATRWPSTATPTSHRAPASLGQTSEILTTEVSFGARERFFQHRCRQRGSCGQRTQTPGPRRRCPPAGPTDTPMPNPPRERQEAVVGGGEGPRTKGETPPPSPTCDDLLRSQSCGQSGQPSSGRAVCAHLPCPGPRSVPRDTRAALPRAPAPQGSPRMHPAQTP